MSAEILKQDSPKKRIRKIFLTIIIFSVMAIFTIFQRDPRESLLTERQKSAILIPARVKHALYRSQGESSGRWEVDYFYTLNGREFLKVGEKIDGIYEPDHSKLNGRWFPLLISRSNSDRSDILITPGEFAYYGYEFPDSLYWLSPYLLQQPVEKICVDKPGGGVLLIAHLPGSDSIYIKEGPNCAEVKQILSFKNVSISDIVLPQVSVRTRLGDGQQQRGAVYFLNDHEFYLGVIGVNHNLNLYQVSLKSHTVIDHGIHTWSSTFYIDPAQGILMTTTGFEEVQDSLFRLKINLHDLQTMDVRKTLSYKFHHNLFDSVFYEDVSMLYQDALNQERQ
ncbi:hypothetical protein KK062_20000 [Fulvivirgaceae bacterium PWU5]|uniref:Uncharacterized protein n=1 Tax=Dawidia cretensis TaxID=2782350 RepID=A0AAP2E200_9BACT|nr:hypothetical protein [Dawidia cretensis]MBT1710538.1 hypothetical protein [Dawidia cretensis]